MRLSSSWAVLLPIISTTSIAADMSKPVETVVITANRYEQALSSVLAPITVIERDDIAASQAKSLEDILRFLPSIDVGKYGGRGQQASIFIRGTNSAHTLVLLDGVKINSATDGAAKLAMIPAAVIERVEYLRGARASIYGADAVGGVINIITNSDLNESKLDVAGGVGGNNYYQASVRSYSQLNASTSVQFTVNHEDSDGYNVKLGSNPDDKHGYGMTNLIAGINHEWNKHWQAELRGVWDQSYTKYDKGSNPEYGLVGELYREDRDNYLLQGKLNFNYSFYYSQLAVNTTNYYSEQKPDKQVTESEFSTVRDSVNWLNSFEVAKSSIVNFGAEWEQENVAKSSTAYTDSSRKNQAAYLTGITELASLMAEASVRYDDNESYGDNVTYNAAAGWEFLPDSMQVKVSYATAFKAPSFNDLYGPWGGDPDLKPQDAKEAELALQGSFSLIDWQLSAYRTEIDNMIIWYSDGPDGWYADNVDATIKGFEFESEFDTGILEHSFNATFMDPKDSKGNQLARRSKASLSWKGRIELDSWDFVLAGLYKSKRFSDTANSEELPAYTLWDFAVSYRPIDSVSLSARIENVFDEGYETAKGYNTQERISYLTLTYSFL